MAYFGEEKSKVIEAFVGRFNISDEAWDRVPWSVTRPLARIAREHGEMREAMAQLIDWMREHTSPRDANSPHLILVRAAQVLATVDGNPASVDGQP